MGGTWSIRVVDEAPLTLVPVLAGSCWFHPDGGEPSRLSPGDIVVARSPMAYVLSSEPDLAPTITIGEGQQCSGDARDLTAELAGDLRTWGNDPNGPDALLVGTYRSDAEVGRVVLADLPPYAVVCDPAPQIVAVLRTEIPNDHLGQSSVLDRLLDLLMVATLRKWYAEHPPFCGDPAVAQTIRRMQNDPSRNWTVADLAREAQMSRALLARRFAAATGVPPIAYLTRWRLASAADLLHEPSMTITAIARRVGYATPYSLSAAFKKEYGVSPQHYRESRD